MRVIITLLFLVALVSAVITSSVNPQISLLDSDDTSYISDASAQNPEDFYHVPAVVVEHDVIHDKQQEEEEFAKALLDALAEECYDTCLVDVSIPAPQIPNIVGVTSKERLATFRKVCDTKLSIDQLLLFVGKSPEDQTMAQVEYELNTLVYDRILYTAWYTHMPSEKLPVITLRDNLCLASDFAIAKAFKHVAKTAVIHAADQARKRYINQILELLFHGLPPSRQLVFYESIKTIENTDFIFMIVAKISRNSYLGEPRDPRASAFDDSEEYEVENKMQKVLHAHYRKPQDWKRVQESDNGTKISIPRPHFEMFAPLAQEVTQQKLERLIQTGNADLLPMRVPVEYLTRIEYERFETWVDRNQKKPYIQEWLTIIFRSLQARTIDQAKLMDHVMASKSVRFDLKTLVLVSKFVLPNTQVAQAYGAELHKQINTEAVRWAWTDLDFEFRRLLEDRGTFDLALVYDAKLVAVFDTLRLHNERRAKQVLAILKHLFQSWLPSRQLEFVRGCGKCRHAIDKSQLLYEAISESSLFLALLMAKPGFNMIQNYSPKQIKTEQEATAELSIRMERFRSRKISLSDRLDDESQARLVALRPEKAA